MPLNLICSALPTCAFWQMSENDFEWILNVSHVSIRVLMISDFFLWCFCGPCLVPGLAKILSERQHHNQSGRLKVRRRWCFNMLQRVSTWFNMVEHVSTWDPTCFNHLGVAKVAKMLWASHRNSFLWKCFERQTTTSNMTTWMTSSTSMTTMTSRTSSTAGASLSPHMQHLSWANCAGRKASLQKQHFFKMHGMHGQYMSIRFCFPSCACFAAPDHGQQDHKYQQHSQGLN
jgi:hypothetical protein